MRRRPASAALAFSLLVPAGVPASAAEAPAPSVTVLLPGGAGDGGPATKAQVNALALTVDAAGDQWFYDRLSRQVRRVAARTGVVTAALGNPGSVPPPAVAFDPPLSYVAVHQLWVVGPDVYLDVALAGGLHRVVRVAPDGTHTVAYAPPGDGGAATVRLVRRDATMVLDWRHGDGSWATYLVPAGGGVPRRVAGHGTRSAAEAADGTVVLLRQDGTAIGQLRPRGGVRRLAGGLAAGLVAVTPDAQRVVFATQGPDGPRLYGFEPGGPVTPVATPAGDDAAERVCDADLTALAAGPAGIYSACGGPVRLHDSAPGPETPPGPGRIVAGANAVRGWTDAAPGTPAALAYLGRVRDTATGPGGRVAMATRSGVYTLSPGDRPVLERLLAAAPGPDPDPSTLRGRQYADHLEFAEPGVDIDFAPDGTLYVLGRDHGLGLKGWVLRSVRPGEEPVLLAGGGAEEPAPGGTGRGSRLGPGRLAVSADGARAYVAQAGSARVWALDLATNRLAHVAGGGPGPAVDDVPATGAALGAPAWLGRDARTGDLLVADGNLHRLDAAGYLRAVPSGAGPTYATTADGSTWSAAGAAGPAAERLWRRQPDGAFVRDGAPSVGPRVAAGPGGGLVVVDAPGASGRVRTVVPAAPVAWCGPVPELAVAPAPDAGGRLLRVAVRLPAAAQDWRLVVRVAVLPRRPGPDLGDLVLRGTVPRAGGVRTATVRGLPADRGLVVGVYATNPDRTLAPPAVVREVPAEAAGTG